MKISEITSEKNIVSARVNKFIYNKYKEKNIPLTIVIEASLVYFLKLTTKDKIKFISENTTDNVDENALNISSGTFTDELKEYLNQMNLSHKIISSLLSGSIAILVSIVAGAFLYSEKNED